MITFANSNTPMSSVGRLAAARRHSTDGSIGVIPTAFRKRGKLALILLSISAICFGQSAKLAPDFAPADSAQTVTAIVQFSPSSAGSEDRIIRQGGGMIQEQLPLIHAALVIMRAGALAGFREQSKCFVHFSRPPVESRASIL
jgi:hypothetical protein